MEKVTLLYGRKEGEAEYMETLLCSQSARFEDVKKQAGNDGFKYFRVSKFKLDKPDFTKTIQR